MFDWIGTLVALGILSIVAYYAFYPTFEEWLNKFWEELDRIKEKFKRGDRK